MDRSGNVVSQIVDIDWGCVAKCIASECAGCFIEGLPPGPCDLCCPLCVVCYYISLYMFGMH